MPNLAEQSKKYVAAARIKKARKMAFCAWVVGITASDMRCADEDQWGQLALAASVPAPSAVTRSLTLAFIEELEEKGVAAA